MRLKDLFLLAYANLLRNRGRSLMTLVGVAIGVMALLSLLAYGTGLQRNVRLEFNELELYNALRVTSTPSPIDAFTAAPFAQGKRTWIDTIAAAPLTDSLVQVFRGIEGVLAAYPEITFPVELEANDQEIVATAEAIPLDYAGLSAYQPVSGRFFTADTDSAIIISPSMAQRLGFDPPTSAIGQPVSLTTASLDVRALQIAARAISQGMGVMPIRKQHHTMTVAGIIKEDRQPLSGFVRVFLPLERAKQMEKITFFSTLDLLLSRGSGDGYQAVRVQLTDREAFEPVRAALREQGFYVMSLRDQFQRLERVFLIVDLALGIIGFIALLVATIGIANTMMMNVMERQREIGVMKALGGEEGDLQRLFIIESTLLGVAGGIVGLLAGWGVTAFLEMLVNRFLKGQGIPEIEVFYISPTAAIGIFLLAALVSLLAGTLPARRAARIEPIKALRGA